MVHLKKGFYLQVTDVISHTLMDKAISQTNHDIIYLSHSSLNLLPEKLSSCTFFALINK